VSDQLSLEQVDGIALVRMQRPPANALAPDFLAEGAELMERLRSEPPRSVVLTGSAGFFSGGVDLKLAPTLSAGEQRGMVAGINRLFCDWYGFPRPVVAAVNGHAVAGGFILALCADHRIGSNAASYGLTELRVGAPYPVAAMAVVQAELHPPAARRLVLGAELVDGQTALASGALDELAEPDAVLERSLEVARGLAELPAATYELVKSQLRGERLEAMLEAVKTDPLSEGWFSEETPEAAAAVLRRG
jgi:enoyl-CoA hydratase/carnithine racemase